MSDNFFEGSTAAIATIYTILVLGIVASLIIWG
jgi:hypothetical protein